MRLILGLFVSLALLEGTAFAAPIGHGRDPAELNRFESAVEAKVEAAIDEDTRARDNAPGQKNYFNPHDFESNVEDSVEDSINKALGKRGYDADTVMPIPLPDKDEPPYYMDRKRGFRHATREEGGRSKKDWSAYWIAFGTVGSVFSFVALAYLLSACCSGHRALSR